MGWLKVTPETMPPEYKTIIATIKTDKGEKYVSMDVQFRPDSALNKWWAYDFTFEEYVPLEDNETVTHWMIRIEPAED